jgi:hypothetical protein
VISSAIPKLPELGVVNTHAEILDELRMETVCVTQRDI